MSFLTAVSTKRVYGLIRVNGTTNSDGVIIFIKNVFSEIRSKNNDNVTTSVAI